MDDLTLEQLFALAETVGAQYVEPIDEDALPSLAELLAAAAALTA